MNLTQLQAAIQALGYTTDTAAQQTIFLNSVYREVTSMDRWKFLEKRDTTLFTVAGTPNYTPPMSDWRNFDAVRLEITASQQFMNLRFKPEQEFREFYHIDRDVSTPYYWTLLDQQLWFYPVPDQAYQATIDYIFEPPDLVAGGDVPVLPIPYHDILVWGAIEHIAYRERDWLGRQFAQGKKETLLKRMQEEYMIKQRQTSSSVRKSGYWETQYPYPFGHTGF